MIDLYEGEKILIQRRRHWYAIASEASVVFAGAVFPLFFFAGSFGHPAAREAIMQFLPIITFAFSAWLILLWLIFFVMWTNYYLDVFVVTNKRIIDIEQKGLFAHDVAETRLHNIQDIKVEIMGVIPSLLDFGDLHVQTAGQSKEILIKKIPKAHEVRDVISRELHK